MNILRLVYTIKATCCDKSGWNRLLSPCYKVDDSNTLAIYNCKLYNRAMHPIEYWCINKTLITTKVFSMMVCSSIMRLSDSHKCQTQITSKQVKYSKIGYL
jgi:predicted ArsR family transcriptional regulator